MVAFCDRSRPGIGPSVDDMLRPALQRLQQSRFVKAYLLALERRPLTTKCATSGLLMVGADATRQRLEDAEQPYDAPRTARATPRPPTSSTS